MFWSPLRYRFSSLLQTHPRFYKAAAYADTPPLSARIRKQGNLIHLQALTTQQIGPQLAGLPSLREALLGTAWHTVLSIDNANQQMIHGQGGTHSIDSPLSQPTSPDNIVFPEKLYGIPQNIWDRFIQLLDDQPVVKALNLQYHRHLWLGYHYAMSAASPNVRMARAQLIGQYHFLLPIAVSNFEAISHDHSDEDETSWFDMKHRNEFNMTAIRYIKADLDQGKFDIKTVMTLHHGITQVLVNKLCHCTHFLEFILLITLISNYSKFALEKVETDKQHTAINWLPSSSSQPIRFAKSLQMAKVSSRISTQSGLLFFNSRTQWPDFNRPESEKITLCRNYFNALFHDLILREVLVQADALSLLIEDDSLEKIKEKFEAQVIKRASISQCMYFSTRWKHNMHVMQAVKPMKNATPRWSPLIPDLVFNGMKVHALKSHAELVEIGQELENCLQLGQFRILCRNNGGNLLLLIDKKNTKSIIHLAHDRDYILNIVQYKAYAHLDANFLHSQTGVQLVKALNAGEIQLSQKRKTEYLYDTENPLSDFDYDITDLMTQEKVYQKYIETGLLPKSLIFATYQDMLMNTGMRENIDKILTFVTEETSTLRYDSTLRSSQRRF